MKTVIINANIISGTEHKNGCAVVIKRGVISKVFEMRKYKERRYKRYEVIDAKGLYVTPGLCDTHIHGMGGFGTEDATEEAILGMSKALAQFGVTSFLPTIYPNGKEDLFKAEEAIVSAMGKEEGARILGVNVEGPFVSPNNHGALPVKSLSNPNIKYFDEIYEHAHGHLVCMTVAPELKGVKEFAQHATEKGVVLLCGHTCATFEQANKGFEYGIKHTTHFFNAMSKLHHREPGVVGAVLMNEQMDCEIIPDGVHVNKDLVKFVIKTKTPEHVCLITDSLKPNAQKTGKLYANGVEVKLSKIGAFVSADNPELINGSALTLNRAISNLNNWGVGPETTIQMATKIPARIYSFKNLGEIKKGYTADVCVFDKDFNAVEVLVAGKRIAHESV